ncbi:carbohydrate binding domain-containing protein [Clostridium sp. LP20]|uniref:carbohydrate binding domain-containing protein n=1 Tax=Clostridium sp. LP20 TaxID=3418665 RepID=UPI003EE7B5A5
MYNVSNNYKTEIQKPSRKFDCKVTIGDRIFTNEQVQSIDLNGGIQDVFSIGNTPSMCLDLTLRNTADTIFSINQVKVEIGLKIGNSIEYIPMGIFNIEDIKKDDYTTKFTCYDNMTKFETAYFSSLGDTPTITQVVNELVTKTGVQFTGSLPAYTVKKLEGFTCREVLGYVASVCGGNAVITRDGKFTIIYPTDVNRDIGKGVFDLQRDEVKYKVGKITCQIKDQETISKGTLGTDSMELLFENPWVTETILTDIYNRLSGFNYLGYTMKWQGDLTLDVGDIITYTDVNGVTRKFPILSRKLSYDGGLDSELSAKGETKNSNTFSSNGSMGNKVDRVVTDLALVNKAFVDYAHINNADITNLKSETAKIGSLEVETANINNLLAGNIGAGNVQTIHLTGKNVVFEDAVIKDLIASKISVADLLAGNISTNKFKIISDNGGIEIVGATQQFKDKNNKVRIQMGQDTQGNFNFIVKAEDGTTTLIDGYGVKEKALADDLIKERMIASNAIGEKQINYSSLITGLNKDTNTQLIKASKVDIDLEGQRLDVAFKSLKSNVDSKESRNLILNGDFNNSLTSWNKNGGMSEVIKEGERNVLRLYANDSSGNRGVNQTITTGDVKTNENYTLSLMCKKGKLAGAFKYYIWYLDNNGAMISSTNKDISVTNEYSKLIETFKVPNNDNIKSLKVFIYCQEFTPTELFIYDIKIEKGININPVYSKAPEDVDRSMQTLQTSITTNIEGIKTLVKDTTITKEGKDIKLKDAYSSLEQNVGSITQRVESVETMKIGVNNLLVNSGFETGNLTGWNFREWRNIGSVNSGFDLSSSTTKYYLLGKHTPFLNAANVVNTEVGGVLEYGKLVPVKPNTQYVLSFYRAVFRGKVTQEHSFRDATGKELGYIINGATEVTDEANRITKNNITDDMSINETPINGSIFKRVVLKFTTPSSCTQLKIMSVLQYSYSDAYYFMDNVQLVEGNKITDWMPGIEEVREIADTSKSNIDNMFSDSKITPLEKKELKKEWDSIVKNYASNLSLATTLKANTTDYTAKYNALVTAVSGIFTDMTATTERNLTNLRTAFVNFYNSEQTLLNSLTGGIENRVSSTEQKLTPSGITTTITEAINSGGNNKIDTTSFVMAKDGLTVKNGAIKIQNKKGEDVLKGDTDGNLDLRGNITTYSNATKSLSLKNGRFNAYDVGGEYLGSIVPTVNVGNESHGGLSMFGAYPCWYMSFGTDYNAKSETDPFEFTPYLRMRFTSDTINGKTYYKGTYIENEPLRIMSSIIMQSSSLYFSQRNYDQIYNASDGSTALGVGKGFAIGEVNTEETIKPYFSFVTPNYPGGEYSTYGFNMYGWLDMHNKSIYNTNLAQSYSSYTSRSRSINYKETSSIEGLGKQIRVPIEAEIKNKSCRIDVPPVFIEVMEKYKIVGLTKFGRGDIWISEVFDNYFIVEAENDIKFSLEIVILKKDEIMTLKSRMVEDDRVLRKGKEELPKDTFKLASEMSANE